MKSGREQKQQYQREREGETDERGIFLITLGYCQDSWLCDFLTEPYFY